MFKRIFNSMLFRRTICYYTVLVVIAISVSTGIYLNNRSRYAQEIIDGNLSQLENQVNAVDDKFKSLFHSFDRISKNKVFLSFVGMTGSERDFNYTVYQMCDELRSGAPEASAKDEFFLYFSNSDMFINKTAAAKEEAFGDIFPKYGDDNFKEWSEKYLHKTHFHRAMPAASATYANETKQRIMYIYTYPNGVAVPSCSFVLLIDMKQLLKNFNSKYSENDVSLIIADSSGEILVNMGNSGVSQKNIDFSEGCRVEKIGNESYVISCVKSKYNRWNYVQIIPEKIAFNKIRRMNLQVSIILMAAVLLILVIIIIMAERSLRPIRKIIGKLRPDDEIDNKIDELEYLDGTLIKLISSNSHLSGVIEKNAEQMQSDFLFRVLKGSFRTSAEAETSLKTSGLDIMPNEIYTVFILENPVTDSEDGDADGQLALRKQLLIQMLVCRVRELLGKSYGVDCGGNVAIILPTDTSEAVSQMNTVLRKTEEEMQLSLSAFSGLAHEGIMGIFYSYNEASEAMNVFCSRSEKKVYLYTDIERKNGCYYYPLALEEKLFNFASVGEKDEVEKILRLLYDKNFTENTLSAEMFDYLKNNLISTLVRIIDAVLADNENQMNNLMMMTKDISSSAGGSELFSALHAFFSGLCDVVDINNKTKDSKIRQRIEEYLEENYARSELCLRMVADDFGFSEAYFSRLFKSTFQMTYSDYVEKLRIEKSLAYFDKPGVTINTMAESVGYMNAQVFRRAFKRQKGVTPSEYKMR